MVRERATKKQQELLQFIGDFLREHDFAPSYREIMRALNYKSVSTVAVHVDGLIAKGYLTKLDKSARSVRIVETAARETSDGLKWLKAEIASREIAGANEAELATLRQALDILSTKK